MAPPHRVGSLDLTLEVQCETYLTGILSSSARAWNVRVPDMCSSTYRPATVPRAGTERNGAFYFCSVDEQHTRTRTRLASSVRPDAGLSISRSTPKLKQCRFPGTRGWRRRSEILNQIGSFQVPKVASYQVTVQKLRTRPPALAR